MQWPMGTMSCPTFSVDWQVEYIFSTYTTNRKDIQNLIPFKASFVDENWQKKMKEREREGKDVLWPIHRKNKFRIYYGIYQNLS